MLKRFMFQFALFAAVILVTGSCKKDNNDNPQPVNTRQVKFEITGNFTGKFTVIYSDNINGNTVLNNVTVPWSKEITYPASVSAVGIGGQASTNGLPGQTATLKIYSGGSVVQSSLKTAGSLGELVFQTLGYTF